MPLKIEVLEDPIEVYDITVEDDHNFYANDILVHNCVEVTLPTKPFTSMYDENGEIALCTLAALNIGKFRDTHEIEKYARLTVRFLDTLLDYQNYPIGHAKRATLGRRPIGIGIINLAYFLAKNGITYQNPEEGLPLVHEWAEAISYYLIKASVELAQERGPAPLAHETKYYRGVVPIDNYKRDVDDLVEPVYKQDWNLLRNMLCVHGIRNSTLMAGMPAETSALTSNSTNGFEPPRALVSVKSTTKQVVPQIKKLKNKYDLLWDQVSPIGYLKICAVFQKFIDQAISVNTSYNPNLYPDQKIPMDNLIRDLIFFYKHGGKNLYYHNQFDDAGEKDVNQGLPLEEMTQESCDGCVI